MIAGDPGPPREDADVESSSDAYALRFSGEVGAWFLERQARITEELLLPFPRARLVEFGGGHGQLAGPLVSGGHRPTIYASADTCRARVEPLLARGDAEFVSGDLLHAPFADRSFDAALAFRLLPHVADWRGLVRELCRVAAKAVIVDYPTLRSVNAVAFVMFGLKKKVEKDTRPFRVFREAEIADAFREHGFRVTARRGQFAIPMAAHRALGSATVSRAAEGTARLLGLGRLLGSPVILRAVRGE